MTDREKLISILSQKIYPREGVDAVEAVADYLLDNGLRPVVHGHWEYVQSSLLTDYKRCSICGNITGDYIINKQTFDHDNPYYCPNCGAKIDEVSE